ncbi:WD40 repeat-like protein [Ascodesmis nigricans]|uniref:WD40 repeat-like protein n=1 Tax=Ascodesmis nigricans TaxID=341454 RepID=A0A4V3SJE3_9PEZI|nr:WD40 repeat-like protein [Ascodesmis nigricans]
MARKARQRISYVLPLANSPGHRLGVNSLAIDSNGILYSAGRDGAICSWNLNVDLNDHSHSNHATPSTFRNQIQAHTHWVNDIVLCQNDSAVVSCSSDLTVKLWRPSESPHQTSETIGQHTDYIKCLATGNSGGWIASGSLDRKIKFWDVNGGGEILQIDVGENGNNPKGSVYSMGTGGGILASGSPDSVVRVWDPRTGDRVTKFVGHTDNLRAILVSQDGSHLLTASSDTTVKLWSMAAGRCVYTLSMHNDSVWSLYSDHPNLEIFHSSDRSGLIAKTDLRHAHDVDEGLCVAVCQETEGVSKVVARGDYIWGATSGSSIKRWVDVDMDSPVGTRQRSSTMTSRPRGISMGTTASGYSPSGNGRRKPIPTNALLRLSSSSSFNSNVRDPDSVTVYSVAGTRHPSIHESDGLDITLPVNEGPDYIIQGQHGLTKHFMLNDRRRVLTVDTAGEVVMWDLLKCCVVKTFGQRHLEEVATEVNTIDSIANWCQVDTRTGRLACVLEENYCFDAETYADEADLDKSLEFRDDQRINLGKWVLRYLFDELISAEIEEDEKYRHQLESQKQSRDGGALRNNAPAQISIPSASLTLSDSASMATPLAKPSGTYSLFPTTPGMAIGLATPAPFSPTSPSPGVTADDDQRLSIDPSERDYFSPSRSPVSPTLVDQIPSSTPASVPTVAEQPPTLSLPSEEEEAKSSSRFGKWRPFGSKKLGRSISTDLSKINTNSTTSGASSEESKSTTDSTTALTNDAATAPPPSEPDDTLLGVITHFRKKYDALARQPRNPDDLFKLESAITPSLPTETPVLKPPRGTEIIIQEDKPDSGGVVDLYCGTVSCVGKDRELVEKVAPAWLGDVLLLNSVPFKDTIKVSFVLVPWKDELPTLPSENGSEGKPSRLNANRMLRAKKILAYIAERLQPPYMKESFAPGKPQDSQPSSSSSSSVSTKSTRSTTKFVKPEDWLELLCHDQLVPLTMTLATIRSYMWKNNGDVTLSFRRKIVKGEVKSRPVSAGRETVVVQEE